MIEIVPSAIDLVPLGIFAIGMLQCHAVELLRGDTTESE